MEDRAPIVIQHWPPGPIGAIGGLFGMSEAASALAGSEGAGF